MTAVAALLALLVAQQTAPPSDQLAGTLTGTVIDASTSAPLAGARVLITNSRPAVLTGPDGRFRFANLPAGRYTLTVSLIGYSFVRRPVELARGAALDLRLPMAEGTGAYQEEVTVQADERAPPEVGVSSQSQVGSADLLALRGAAADDPIRAVQALPGVTTGNDFDAEFSMRGFAFNQIGIVMDGTATPLLLHEIRGSGDSGSIAMINSDVLDGASLVAGPQPERDGDWLGSTLSFAVREGSRDRPGFRLSVSGTSASVVAEGPLGTHHRGSWLLSARKSYLDWIVRKIEPDLQSTIGFSDTQGKFVYDLTAHQQVQFMFVGGLANLDSPQETSTNGLNHATSRGGVAAATWRHTGGRAVYTMRVALTDNAFTNQGAVQQVLGTGDLHERSWRGDASWTLSPTWTAEAGLKTQSTHDHALEQDFSFSRTGPVLRLVDNGLKSTLTADGWGALTWRGTASAVSMGARTSYETLTARTVVSPWILAEHHLAGLTFRASVGESHQFPSLDAQIGAVAPLVPAHAVSVDVGLEQTIGKTWRWQLTGFARQDDGVLREVGEDRIQGLFRIAASPFPEFTSTLSGPTHGADLIVSRRAPTGVNGWIAYTYSHTRYHDGTTGESFDGDFDQRHTLNVFLEERLSYRFSVNGKLRVGSNFPLTGYFAGTPEMLLLGSTYNAVRLPVYARLDLRANRTFTFNRRRLTLFIEVLNVLNRNNLGQLAGVIVPPNIALGYTTGLIPRIPSAGLLWEF
jgi:hypothetical protein